MLRITKGVVVLLSLGGLAMQFVGLSNQLDNSPQLKNQIFEVHLANQISDIGNVFMLPDKIELVSGADKKNLRQKLICPPDQSGFKCGESPDDPYVTFDEFLASGAAYEDFCEGEFSLSHLDITAPDELNYCSEVHSILRRRYTLTDACGYSKSCLQRFFYEVDIIPPTTDCSVLEDVYVGCDDYDLEDQVQSWLEASTNEILNHSDDNCKSITISHDYTGELNCENLEGLTVIYFVSDACNQKVSCEAKILPRPPKPALEQPHDKKGFTCLSTLPVPAITIEEYIALGGSIEEHCGKGLTISHTDIGDVASIDICSDRPIIIRRRYTVKDGCGNSKSTIQRFEFQRDTEPPTIDCGTMNDFVVDCDKALLEGEIQDWISSMENKLMKSALDNCSAIEVKHNYTANSAAEMNCAADDRMLIRFSVSDRCRNSSFCEAMIISSLPPAPVPRPEVVCVDDILVKCGENVQSPALTLEAFEAAGGEIILFCEGELTISSEDVGSENTVDVCSSSQNIIRRRYIIHDECGNEKRCLQRIIFEQDIMAPIVDCDLTNDLLVSCDAVVSADDISKWLDQVSSDLEVSSMDNCSDIVISNDYEAGSIDAIDCDSNSELSVTYLIVDQCGNTTSCSVTLVRKEIDGPGLVLGNVPKTVGFKLYQNNPNPFDESTNIRFNLERAGKVSLTIYDVSGKLLFKHNKEHSEGMNNVKITRDLIGNASGVIFYTLESEGYKEVKSMILLE